MAFQSRNFEISGLKRRFSLKLDETQINTVSCTDLVLFVENEKALLEFHSYLPRFLCCGLIEASFGIRVLFVTEAKGCHKKISWELNGISIMKVLDH